MRSSSSRTAVSSSAAATTSWSRRARSTARSGSTAGSRRRSQNRKWPEMKVWQPGSHLIEDRSARPGDWSWAATKRRLRALYRLAKPYKPRVAIALLALLGATAISLVPPILIGTAVDQVSKGKTDTLGWIVVAFVAAGGLG